ncbi:retrotransposon protein, putative, ty1-copia subclass [Tanacetum coccineum]|uniref:Retrotransposon protein, putative, ty1-copia subclass n=1 Tax=Tanacetum coccineum TaxID=301880 RepID=A0ABQ5HNV5_9ASTR
MIQELRSMFKKQAGVEKFDLIQSFHACKQDEDKRVAYYVLKMKGYVEQLERLGYVLPQDVTVGLILNGLTKDFVGFVRNYNMHNMGGRAIANKKLLKAKGKNKVNGKGKDKKVYIPKPKNPKPTAMERQAKDDACHHCIFMIESFSLPNNNSWVYDTGCANGIIQQLTPPYTPQQYGVSERRNRTLLDMVRSMMNFTTLTLSFWDYALGHGDKVEALVKRAYADKREQRSVKAVALEEIQEEEDTTPSEITSNIPQEVEGFKPPQPPPEEDILIRRSERTRRVPNCLCLNVEVEEHSLGNLNEPTSYKATRGWVVHGFLRKKTDMDGIVHVYKARLVAKGYTQLYGVDYEERKVSKLQRSLWVLKQALNEAEYKRFDEGIKRDLGETNLFLESKSHRDRIERRFIGLSQMPYMDKILKRYKMDNSKRGTIPMQERLDLNKSQGAQTPKEVNRMKNVPYASAVRIHRNIFLVYGGNPETELRVDCYCNAGFETDIDDMKSLTRYISF